MTTSARRRRFQIIHLQLMFVQMIAMTTTIPFYHLQYNQSNNNQQHHQVTPQNFNQQPIQPEAAAEGEDDGVEDVKLADGSRQQAALRRRLRGKQSTGQQAGDSAAEDWRTFDVTKAMSNLNSNDPAVRKKAIQRLHVRWWHAQTEALTRTLQAAGAPSRALADVQSVVQACNICRDWKRPGPRNIATFFLETRLNI